MDNRYTEGICHDGAAILDNGQMITITEILNRLNKGDALEKENQELRGLVDSIHLISNSSLPNSLDTIGDMIEKKNSKR